MREYKAILFAPDGDYVTDFKSTDKQAIWDLIGDHPSRWIFYPIPFVAASSVIVDTPDGLEFLKLKRIETVAKYLKREWSKRKRQIADLMNSGFPLSDIYKL